MSAEQSPESRSAQDMDRLRDILLGPPVRDIDQRIQLLQNDLERLQRLFDGLAEQLAGQSAAQAQQLQQEGERLTRQLTEQEAGQAQKLQQATERLTSQLVAQDESHNRKLQEEIQHLSKSLTEGHSESAKELQSLRSEMRQAEDALRQELRQSVDRLSQDKSDRQALGQLFVQVGNQLIRGDEARSLNDQSQGQASEQD